jgi:hypothetical protein
VLKELTNNRDKPNGVIICFEDVLEISEYFAVKDSHQTGAAFLVAGVDIRALV